MYSENEIFKMNSNVIFDILDSFNFLTHEYSWFLTANTFSYSKDTYYIHYQT